MGHRNVEDVAERVLGEHERQRRRSSEARVEVVEEAEKTIDVFDEVLDDAVKASLERDGDVCIRQGAGGSQPEQRIRRQAIHNFGAEFVGETAEERLGRIVTA